MWGQEDLVETSQNSKELGYQVEGLDFSRRSCLPEAAIS